MAEDARKIWPSSISVASSSSILIRTPGDPSPNRLTLQGMDLYRRK